MRPTAPENFDDDATTDRLDPTWKAQVDLLDPTCRSNYFPVTLPTFLFSPVLTITPVGGLRQGIQCSN